MSTRIAEALSRGDTATALAAARKLVQAEPENAEARHLLGQALQRQGDLAGAQAAFERAVALAPENPAYPFALASLAISRGDLDTAERHAKLATGLDPNHLPSYVIAGQATLMRRDRVEAARQLRMAQRINAEHPWVQILEGYLARFDGDEEKAMACFTAAAKTDPNLPAAQLALGLGYLKKDMLPFAEQALRNARVLAPHNTAVAQTLLEVLRRQGKVAEALEVIEPLAAALPNDPAMRLLRAELRGANGRPAEGLEDALALVQQHPTHLRMLSTALELMRQLGRDAEGVPLVERALELAPTEDRLWTLRGALAGNLGEDPAEVLRRWTQARPDSAVAWEQLAGMHDARGELEPMAEAALRALALKPGLVGASLMFAKARMAQAPAEVLERLQAAVAANTELPPPSRRTLLAWQALALDRLQRYGEAAERMREAVAIPIMRQQPLPKLRPAEGEPTAAAGTLFWTLPGVRVEPLMRGLLAPLGERLRNNPELMFGNQDPSAVCWLPFVDGHAVNALAGATWLVVVADPRDAFLSWLLFGASQGYRFTPDPRDAAFWLAEASRALIELQAREPGKVHWIRQDGDREAAASRAGMVLGVELGAELLAPPPLGPGEVRFEPGHWRHYREAFAHEFKVLEPVVKALGYAGE
ncbi:MAG TPA: tetratricopeptide repeat protein [Arenimonas sp.]|nr:tetratricopeptide repeat protein [Arenimonas sp.]